MKKIYIFVLAFASLLTMSAMAQQKITGVIKNQHGDPLLGAIVSKVGDPTQKTMTDNVGSFTIEANKGNYIEVTYDGNKRKRIFVDNDILDIQLGNSDLVIDNQGEKQSLRQQTQAISTISGNEIAKNSTPNVSNSLFGLLSGLTSIQNTGWSNAATLMVRGGGSLNGASPLIVVDGIPRTLEYLNTLEVESVSVLKDGAATALWGTRGANGVILVATKRGQYEKREINVNYTYGVGLPVNQPVFVDGHTFATMKNEALYYDGLPLAYDEEALAGFKSGSNVDLYPNTDWQKEALRNHTVNNQLNVSFRGGGKKMRYYSIINYKNDYGILNNDLTNYSERYDAQMKKFHLNARMNLDIDITDYTLASLSVFGMLHEENRPRTTESNIFSAIYNVPSAAFPSKSASGKWRSDNIFNLNPIAQIADVGYFKTNQRLLQSDLRIVQDLSPLTKGLSAELGIAYDNSAVFQETGNKSYAYETISKSFNPETGLDEINSKISGDDSALDINNGGLNSQFMRAVLSGKLAYDRAFDLHALNGTIQYRQESFTPLGRNNTRKRQSFIFTGGYNYDNRYLVDLVVNQSGTSVLSKGDRYRTYPAVSAAWLLSNESFMKDNSSINYLKLRASWGRSGNDNIEYDLDERYWETAGGYQFRDSPSGFPGSIAGTLPITNLTIEMADKYNLGFDIQLLNKLSFATDVFVDQRRKTLIGSDNVYSAVIGTGIPMQNIGSMDTKGLELSLMWEDQLNKDFSYYVGGTFSYLKTEIKENGEGFKPYEYLSSIGNRYFQTSGLEAIGYFNNQADIDKSPKQMFSDLRPGDIKYKDQNNDGVIDQYDVIPIGYSSRVPGQYYGINLGLKYKGFGIDMVFQGVGQFSRMLNTRSVYWPMRNNNSNLTTWYLDDNIRWTEETKDIANMPRLTTLNNANNFRNSTQWLANGAYFKLRNLNVYYILPQKWTNSIKMNEFQIYVRGNNLFSFDHIKYSNSEDLSVSYPDLISLYFGININF